MGNNLIDSDSLFSLFSIAFIGRLFGRAFTYGMYLYVARALGDDVLGAFTAGLVVVLLGGTVTQFGMSPTVQKYIPIHRKNGDDRDLTGVILISLLVPLIVGSSLIIGLYIVQDFIASLVSQKIVTSIQILVFGVPFYGVYTVGESATLAYKHTKYAVYIRDFGHTGSAFILIIIASLFSPTLSSISIAYVFSLVIASVIAILLLAQLGAFGEFTSPIYNVNEVFEYAASMLPRSISTPITRWTDILVLTLFVTTAQIGWYQASYQTSVLLMFAVVSINSVFPPLASEIYSRNDIDRLQTLSELATKWATTLTLYATVYVIAFREEILWLFGSNFVKAAWILVILSLGRTITAMVGPVGFLLSMTDYERIEMWNTIVVAVLNLSLNLLLVPLWGLFGAAIATTVSLSLLNVVRVIEVRRYLGFWPFTQQAARAVIPVGVGGASMLFVKQASIPVFAHLIFGGVVSFVLFAIITATVSISDDDAMLIRSVEEI